MNTLLELIMSMNKQECRHFKLLKKRTSQSFERKDILLFDFFRNHLVNSNESKIAKKLYGNNINGYYRLKNRLARDIETSLTHQYINKDNKLSIYRTIFVSRLLKTKGNYDLSYYYLLKAEKNAIKNNHLDALNLIYNEIIKLSNEKSSINVETFLEKRKKNKTKINQIQEIDDALAALTYRLKKSQNFAKKDAAILQVMENTLSEFIDKPNLIKTSELKIKVYHAISQILIQKHDFESLEKFLIYSYSDFVKNKLFNKSNHTTKLQMLTYLMNCLCKNNKHKDSLKKAKMLKKAMEEYDNLHFNDYLFYYYNGLAINYNILDKKQAIQILLEAKNDSVIQKSDYNYFFICSNLALQYFDTKQLKHAIKTLSRIILHKSFLDFDISFRIKIICAELIIRYEIGDYDYLELRINKTKKKYKETLAEKDYKRELLLIDILNELIYTERIKQNKPLIKKITTLLAQLSSEQAEEEDVINYNKWILEKL